ncbi:MAG: DJ-1/PfpI family protein [Oscillospiraceae bacterium]|nr:DJ-1/PfpI family protein [Oscillospiraceae bacterium]
MIYVFLANGFEETEAIAPIDILRRSELDVKTVGIGEEVVVSSHGIAVIPDITEVDFVPSDDIDMIVLPGGMPGTLNLEKSRTVQDAIDFCTKNDKYIAAICAAPSILGKKGLLQGRKAVCFPGFEEFLEGAEIPDESVVCDGKIITAKGAGVAVEFGLALSEILAGKPKAAKIKASLQCR